jgi:DNA-binding transcriptional MocR family regulator
MGPLVRLGFIAVTGSLVNTFVNAKLHLVSDCSILAERAALGMLHSGKYRKHLERLRRCLSHARANALYGLTASGIRADHSGEGIFIWGEMPTEINMELLVRSAFAERILLAPGHLFQLPNIEPKAGDSGTSFYLRFNAVASRDIRLTNFLLQYTKID